MKKERLFLGGKMLGYIDYERRCYVSYRNDNHVFHKFGEGFGASVKLLDYLAEKGIKLFVINFKNERGFCADTNLFITRGMEYNDLGDLQLILPREYWDSKVGVEKQELLEEDDK